MSLSLSSVSDPIDFPENVSEKSTDSIERFDSEASIDNFNVLLKQLNAVYASDCCWNSKRTCIAKLLNKVDLTTTETNKYTFFDYEKPYTRNLVATDGTHYTLLILCWNAGMESKIHNHPCDGCFIKTLRGCIKETQYSIDEETNNIKQKSCKFYSEGQVSFMSDDIGLHKIANPNKDVPAVTLHLYTPPFGTCKVWSDVGDNTLSRYSVAKMGYFSCYGHRTPHLEGKPGMTAKMMLEIKEAKQKHRSESRDIVQSDETMV